MRILLQTLLILASLACTPSNEADSVPGLRIWHAYRGEEQAALENVLEQYDQAHPEIQLVILEAPFDGFTQKLESASPRGHGPDLFIGAHERVGNWVVSGLVEPLLWPREELETWLHPVALDALEFEGEVYGLPLASKSLALFRNTSLVAEAPTTTEEMLATARALTDPQLGRYGIAWQATDPFIHAPWMHGYGGGIFFDHTVALDQPGNARSIAWVKELLDEGLLPRQADGALITQLFNQGNAAMVVNGPWFLGEIDPDAGIPFAVSPLPLIDATGAPAAPYLSVEGVFVSAYSTQGEPAAELARWLTEPAAAHTRAVEGHQLVATLETLADPQISEDPILSAFAAQLEHTIPLSNQPEMALTWEPMAEGIRTVFRGESSPEEAMAEAQNEFLRVANVEITPADPLPYLLGFGTLMLGVIAWLLIKLREQWSDIRAHVWSYVWVTPAVLSMLLLVVLPFTIGAGVSLFLHENQEFHFVGLANFENIVFARDYPIWDPKSIYFTLAVTLLWTLSNVFLHVSLGLGLAMILREPWLRMRAAYRVLLILPWAIPNYITALIWKGLFNENFGAVNGILKAIGLEPISWFEQFLTSFCAVLVTNTWLGFPFMMVVTLGALQAIPRDLEQAADIDGASALQRFWYVTLPLIKPALLPAIILGSVWTFNMFNIIYLVSDGQPGGSTEILISEAYKWAFERNFRYGYAAAYAVLVFGVLLLYSKGANKLAGSKVL